MRVLVACLAGALAAVHERMASPETIGWAVSGDAVLYATLGVAYIALVFFLPSGLYPLLFPSGSQATPPAAQEAGR